MKKINKWHLLCSRTYALTIIIILNNHVLKDLKAGGSCIGLPLTRNNNQNMSNKSVNWHQLMQKSHAYLNAIGQNLLHRPQGFSFSLKMVASVFDHNPLNGFWPFVGINWLFTNKNVNIKWSIFLNLQMQ